MPSCVIGGGLPTLSVKFDPNDALLKRYQALL
jgi:hypothetical protein